MITTIAITITITALTYHCYKSPALLVSPRLLLGAVGRAAAAPTIFPAYAPASAPLIQLYVHNIHARFQDIQVSFGS